jgi:cytochrome c556
MKAVAAAILLLAAPPARGQPGPDVIEMRQAGFDLLQADAAAVKAAAQAHENPAPFADDADAMARWGRLIPSLFPPGSDHGGDTAARPEIWTDRAGFGKAAADFAAAAEKLSEAAKSGDADAFAARWKATGATCGACHKAYKVRKD